MAIMDFLFGLEMDSLSFLQRVSLLEDIITYALVTETPLTDHMEELYSCLCLYWFITSRFLFSQVGFMILNS